MARVTGTAGQTKAQRRAHVRTARAARGLRERDLAAAALARHAQGLLPPEPSAVAAYLSTPTEPGTAPLLAALLAAGHRVLVPRVSGERLVWVGWETRAEVRRGPFGIDEPVGPLVPDALAGAAVVFLPALSVDRAGRRLGQGGGFYDRALAEVAAHAEGGPLRVACVFADEVVDTVPHEPHDIRVDLALTPAGVVPLD